MLKVLLFSSIVVPALAMVDTTSIFSYFYSLVVLTLISILVSNDEWNKTLYYYHYYLFFGVLVYLLNKYQLPLYIGTTGPEGIGTDDYTFYGQIVDGNVPYVLEVPAEYKYPFSLFLQAVYPFHINTPLNIVLFNIVFVTFMPFYTGKLADYFFHNKKITEVSKIIVLLCPMTTLYGVIIIRDLLVTTLVLASIYYFLTKKLVPIILCIALVFFVRFGSLSFIAASFLIIYIVKSFNSSLGRIKVFAVVIFAIIAFIAVLPTLVEYSDGKLNANLIRSIDGEYYEGSTIASIISLPFPINIILSSLFYAVAPLLVFPALQDGIFVIISFFNATLTPLYFIAISPFLYTSLLEKHKSKDLKLLIYLLIVFLVVLGTVSLQIRHKNIIFPIMSILAAYGFVRYKRNVVSITILTFVTIFIEVSYSIYSLY